MTISIVTVVRNRRDGVLRTIESLAAQSYRGIQHVVIDGASTDGTVEVLHENRHRIAVLLSEPDKGIYDALNKGLRLADGDVIGILHAEDVYADRLVLQRVAAELDASNSDIVFGDAEFVDPRQPDRVVRRFRSERFSPERLEWGWMPAHPAMFVRKRVFEDTGDFNATYAIAGDFEWTLRAFVGRHTTFRYIPSVLVRMTIGGVSTASWRNTIRLNQEVIRACREHNVKTSWPRLLCKYPAKLLEYIRQ